MKPVVEKVYRCPICGEIFDNIEEAKECVQMHRVPTDVVSCYYNVRMAYPRKVKVKMDDGECRFYILTGERY